jgi:3-oxoacyl-[acyl-carrier protein] reductase
MEICDMNDIKDLITIVTGAAQGIGAGIAEVFAQCGAKVALVDIKADTLEQQRAKMGNNGFDVISQVCDVTIKEQVTSSVRAVAEYWGGVDVLVNNAGVNRDMGFLKMREEDWDDIININLRSQFLCCQAALPYMLKKKFGRIVNISSRAMKGNRGQANYAAAKGGVISLTKSLAMEFAHKGITANAICPGVIETPLFQSLSLELQSKLISTIAVGRIGQPEEVGRVAAFFASRNAGYITGQFIFVCGGRSL